MSRRLSAAAIAVAIAIGAGGCFGGDDRDDLEGYLEDANSIQGSATGLERAERIFRRFAEGKLEASAATAEKVRESAKSVEDLKLELQGLKPPPVAEELHRLLVRFINLNLKLARQTSAFADYVPASSKATEGLLRTNRRMRARLAETDEAGVQIRVLRTFAGAMEPIIRRLGKVEPPPILAGTHDRRAKGLAEIRDLALKLSDALERQDAEDVANLLRRFGEESDKQARSEIDQNSRRRYRKLYRELLEAAQDIRREESRLQYGDAG